MHEPKDNEVQIKMMAAGVCGSDIHIYKGENPNSRYPLIPGHENVGLVTKVGADCKNIKVGDHVVIDYVIRCGECYQCKHGRGNVCEHVLVRGSGTNGGWREYWCVEEPYVYKIDDSIPWKDAALIEPLTIGEHSTSRAGVCDKVMAGEIFTDDDTDKNVVSKAALVYSETVRNREYQDYGRGKGGALWS